MQWKSKYSKILSAILETEKISKNLESGEIEKRQLWVRSATSQNKNTE